MKVKNLVQTKSKAVVSIDAGKSVEDAIRLMHKKKVSAVIVVDGKETVGIFTERDVVRSYVAKKEGTRFREIPVRDAMTKKLLTAEGEDDVCDVMTMMVDRNIRHLPVVEHGRVIAMLSVRDIIQTQVGKFTSEIHSLRDYIVS
jgi:CBS domain-containing protein